MLDAFKAVFWSFFGVRKRADYEADTKRLKPQDVIVAGIVGCSIVVLVLFGIVWLVTRLYYQSLFYVVCVAPEGDEFDKYQPIFEQIIRSVELRER